MTDERLAPVDRRRFLKATGTGVAITGVAGCLENGDGDDADDQPAGGDDESDDADAGEGADDEPDDDGEPIVVAGLQPYSGPFALYGETHTLGIEYAFDQINEEGGVLGRELVHEPVDTESNPAEARSIFTRLVEQEDAVAAVGPVSSDVGVATAQTAEEIEVPLFLHAAGDIDILSRESRNTFRTALPPAPAFMEAVADIIEERGYQTVGVIYADYAWGVAAEAGVQRVFPDDIDLHEATAPANEDDFVPYLRDMPDDLDILVGSGHPPGLNNIFSQMLDVGLEPELFTAAVSPPESNYGAIGDDVERGFSFGHLPDVYSEEYREVAEDFYDATGEYFGPTQAAGYMTGRLIAEGIEQGGEASPAAISDAMREIEFDTIYANPVQYTEWGELDQYSLIWSGFELEAPDYYPEGEFDLQEVYRTGTLEPVDPDDY